MIPKRRGKGQGMQFGGAKVALFLGERLVTILRDDRPGLAYAGHWDLPGGGREGNETPFDCVARECREELGLRLGPEQVIWRRCFASAEAPGGQNWFFAARMAPAVRQRIRFGTEGQGWSLMTPEAFMAHPRAIPTFQHRLRLCLSDLTGGE